MANQGLTTSTIGWNFTGLSEITKLADCQNFPSWKFQITSFLEAQNLMTIVDGTGEIPHCYLDQARFKIWKQKDAAARFCLSSTVVPSILGDLLDCNTSAKMWTELNSQFN